MPVLSASGGPPVHAARRRWGTALGCRRFWLVALPPMWLPLLAYAAGYVLLRLLARIRIRRGTSQVGPVRLAGRPLVSAAALFSFYEPLINWETRLHSLPGRQ